MLTRGSAVVNGQLIPVMTADAYLPMDYAPVAPAALWAFSGQASVPPSVASRLAAAPTPKGGDTPMPLEWTSPESPAGWLHPTRYPVAAAVAFLVLGLAVLRFVHWRG